MDELKIPLFLNYKERVIAVVALFAIFLFNILFEYQKYQKLISSKYFETEAKVLNQYIKKDYYVLKLKSKDGFTFYTTSKEKLKDLRGRVVEILLIKTNKKISFFDFIKGFYYVSYIKGILPRASLTDKILLFISNQHQNHITKELFGALYLAYPISKELRDRLSFLGLSHLVAISGFHLGIISASIFYIFYLFYRPIHKRYFPYRNIAFDAMVVVAVASFIYFLLLGESPSFVRAYVMMCFGFFLLVRNIKILSFETLFWAVLIILTLFIELFFSIGFWLSVAGVFYIYLFLLYFNKLKKWQIFLLLNFWIFFAMIPVVHYFFGNFSYMQFLSPIISMAFIIFYPLSILLHLIGYGHLFDEYILSYLFIDIKELSFKTPLWFLGFYLLLSLISIYKKRIFYLFIFVAFTFVIYQIAKFQTI